MTVQAQEGIEYRGEHFLLTCAPLYPYLENRKDIKFEIYSTAHSCGYQGYWKLEDNKLYLVNIESSNYTFEVIFQTKEPVLAEWYTGSIEFGFGIHHRNHWWGYYDDYLWLNVKEGIVTERKIIKRFYSEPEFEFGKYKGRKFREVLNGKIYQNTYITIKNFIEDLLRFIMDREYGFKILTPYFKIEETDVELVKDIRNWGLQYFLSQNYIAISSKKIYENPDKDERAENLSILLEKILSSDFNNLVSLTKKGLDNADCSENSLLINPDLNYLTWVLKTVDYFCVPPSFLNQTFKLTKLKNIEIKRLNSSIFEYTPVIENIAYEFPANICKINRTKFEKKHNLTFCPEANFYTYTLMKMNY